MIGILHWERESEGTRMLFACHWSYEPAVRDEANARFAETGGLPPEGVRMLGRWHTLGENEGFCVAETDDPEALGIWLQEWSDLLTFSVQPVVDDAAVSRILASDQ
jgi:hypothetical protein